ncbi:MAG TPA: enoyl-CoA hydratase-related protein [Dehalococcoidia bacterium]|jgi:enoyl-CoA hydratase/carnithine racemase|nr:enoyl-CoA hydratase-related protein [Dehalococcoidia bacterium]
MTTTTNDAVLFDVQEHVGTIILNRPDAMNAINADLSAGLMAALRRVREDDAIRVAVLTGNGRAFCAGADLRGRAGGPAASGGPADVFATAEREGFATFDVKKPVIAAVNGYCLGGGFEIALACDLRIAAEEARFALPEITLGFFPLAGAPMRLPRAIPEAFANEMLYLGERIDAQTALRFGIVSRVVPADQLMPTAREMAAKIAGYAPIAVRGMKELIAAQGDMTLPQAMRFGGVLRWIVGQTADAKEGPRAFAEKRTPVFRGE